MRAFWLLMYLAGGGLGAYAATDATDPVREPKALSVHPFTAQRGTAFTATVRGNALRDATSVFAGGAPLSFTIEGTEPEPPSETTPKSKAPVDIVRLRI